MHCYDAVLMGANPKSANPIFCNSSPTLSPSQEGNHLSIPLLGGVRGGFLCLVQSEGLNCYNIFKLLRDPALFCAAL